MLKFLNGEFPHIKDFKIVLKEPNFGIPQGHPNDTRISVIMPSNDFSISYLPCTNPYCRGEGFDIFKLIKEMHVRREEKREGELRCGGRTEDDSFCQQIATYEVSIEYNS